MLFQKMRGTTDNCAAPLSDPLKSAPLLESPMQSDVWCDDIPSKTPEEASVGAGRNGKGWICLKSHMSKGNLLLKLPSKEKEEPQRRRSSLARHTFEEFQTGTNFSVKQCLLAIMAYMVVSIVIFSFVLEPHWTMIDSCYFAVSTFTTLGTYLLDTMIHYPCVVDTQHPHSSFLFVQILQDMVILHQLTVFPKFSLVFMRYRASPVWV
jgi:hypothetical protein